MKKRKNVDVNCELVGFEKVKRTKKATVSNKTPVKNLTCSVLNLTPTFEDIKSGQKAADIVDQSLEFNAAHAQEDIWECLFWLRFTFVITVLIQDIRP